MNNSQKISSYQLFCLVAMFMMGSTIILQSVTAAGRDTWISTLIAIIPGCLLVFLITYLAKLFPGKTLIEYSQETLGKIPGKLVGILYLWYFLYLGSLVLRNYGDFLSTVVLPESMPGVFHITLGLVVAYMVYHRIEVIGRVGEIVFPVIIGLSFAVSLLLTLSGSSELKNLLPVFEQGFGKVLLGSIPIAAFPFQEIIVFTMILPYLNISKNSNKALMGGLLFAGLILVTTLMQSIAVFGDYISTLSFPRYFSVRLLTVGEFIQRIEPIVIIIWIMQGLIKIGVCLYSFATGFSQITGIKDERTILIPSTILMIFFANIAYHNFFEMINFAINIYPFYAFPFQILFPVSMLVLALLKGKNKNQRSQQK